VDRATGQKTELPWPPEAPLGPARTEAPRTPRQEDAGSVAEAGLIGDAAPE